jgi:hypothetical protein
MFSYPLFRLEGLGLEIGVSAQAKNYTLRRLATTMLTAAPAKMIGKPARHARG